MEKFKYLTHNGVCLTSCKYFNNKRVGSILCDQCNYYHERNIEEGYVTCKYKDCCHKVSSNNTFMKTFKEKLKSIYHIIKDKEYAVYTVTVANGERVSSACLISDNASKVFIQSIIKFTSDYFKNKK